MYFSNVKPVMNFIFNYSLKVAACSPIKFYTKANLSINKKCQLARTPLPLPLLQSLAGGFPQALFVRPFFNVLNASQ